MEKQYLTHQECAEAARHIAQCVYDQRHNRNGMVLLYGVPRGGIPVAYLVAGALPNSTVVSSPDRADVFLDDIVDSGATRQRYKDLYPSSPFYDLASHVVRKKGAWVVFPWEVGESNEDTSADDIVIRLLQYIGEDPKREGLLETPKRVLKAWKEWCGGYGVDPKTVLKTFEDGSENYDEMIAVRRLPFYSQCEHHMAPFFGTATIAYVPNKRIVGLSKLGRLLDIYARRLQVQERMTTQIADALNDVLQPKGVGVFVEAQHLCMCSRGYGKQGHTTVTTALRGVIKEDGRAREEFLQYCQR